MLIRVSSSSSFILRAVSQKIDALGALVGRARRRRRGGPDLAHATSLSIDRSFRRSFRRSSSSTRARARRRRRSRRSEPRRAPRDPARSPRPAGASVARRPASSRRGLWKYPGAGRSRRRRWVSWGRVGVRPRGWRRAPRASPSARRPRARRPPVARPRGRTSRGRDRSPRSRPPRVFRATTPRRRSRVADPPRLLGTPPRLAALARSRRPPRRSPPGTSRRPPSSATTRR